MTGMIGSLGSSRVEREEEGWETAGGVAEGAGWIEDSSCSFVSCASSDMVAKRPCCQSVTVGVRLKSELLLGSYRGG